MAKGGSGSSSSGSSSSNNGARQAGATSLTQNSENFGYSRMRLRRIAKLQFGIVNPIELVRFCFCFVLLVCVCVFLAALSVTHSFSLVVLWLFSLSLSLCVCHSLTHSLSSLTESLYSSVNIVSLKPLL
jgi:hypothetical protein